MKETGICISRAYTTEKENLVTHWFMRTKTGKHHVQSHFHKPYFYGLMKDGKTLTHPDVTEIDEKKYISQAGTEVKRIYVKKPKSVSGYSQYSKLFNGKEKIPGVATLNCFERVYESNIEFPDRCAVDSGIKYGMWVDGQSIDGSIHIYNPSQMGGSDDIDDIQWKKVTIDSEVRMFMYDTKNKKELKTGRKPVYIDPINPVLSIQCLDNQTEKIYFFHLSQQYETEKKTGKKEQYIKHVVFPVDDKIKRIVKARDKFTINEHVYYDEKTMLEDFIQFIIKNDYDIIAAFNGMDFDFPYILKRSLYLGLPIGKLSPLGYVTMRLKGDISEEGYNKENDIRIPGRNLIDTMEMFIGRQREKPPSVSLDYFSKNMLNIGKFKHTLSPNGRRHSIDYEFFEDMDTFRNYACRDVILDFYLQKMMYVWDFYLGVMKSTGANLREVCTIDRLKKILKPRKQYRQELLFYLKEFGYIMEPEDHTGERFEGATVEKPEQVGPIEMAADLDVAGMYPSIIRAANISWDTIVLDHSIITDPKYRFFIDYQDAVKQKIPLASTPLKGIYFRRDKVGVIPKMIDVNARGRDDLRKDIDFLTRIHNLMLDKTVGFTYPDNNVKEAIDRRIETWDKDQEILKIKNNSVYGNLDKLLAQCVTAFGRAMIDFTRKVITKMGYPPSYTDTDSVIFKTNKKDVASALIVAKDIEKKINEMYKIRFAPYYNLDGSYLRIKTEELYDPIIFVINKSDETTAAAKKYVKRLVGADGKTIPESEIKIKDKGIIKPQECSNFERDIGKTLIKMSGSNKTRTEIISELKKKIELFKSMSLEDVAFPKKLGQNLDDYKKPTKKSNKARKLDYLLQGIENTNKFSKLWSSVPTDFSVGDTAYLVFVKGYSIPNKYPKYPKDNVWALDAEGELPKEFLLDAEKHARRALTKFEPLLSAIRIKIDDILSKQSILV